MSSNRKRFDIQPDRRRGARSALRVHILAALGVAGCSQVPTPGKPHLDGLYDAIDADGDGSTALFDCNDADASIHPDAEELCNEVDDNCDGVIDEEVRAVYHRDADGDSFGSPTDTRAACELPPGYVENGDDCNDLAAEAHPDGIEVCDGLDNDCDGATDDIPGYWPDEDGDGFGGSGAPLSECSPMPEGYADNQGDCDDTDATVHPGAVETCLDGIDNDCNGSISCLVVEVAVQDSDEVCSATWALLDAEITDWTSPCEGCDFEFRADLELAEVTGDSDLCDDVGEGSRLFSMNGNQMSATTEFFLTSSWGANGTWGSGVFTWASDPYYRALEAGGYAYISYMGELHVDEVEEYYYGYYYYEGRPLSVEGSHLVADETDRTEWRRGDAAIDSLELTVADRRRAVAAWTRAGLAEHASVASFNRFVLELMSLGAPPALLMESLQAAQDEVIHARDCFTVASALAGRDIGPGALPMDGVLDDVSVEGILTRLLAEGCVEETVSTSLAAQRLLHAKDPTIRAALERIVADETRHAALAWRSARWILASRPDLAPLARKALSDAMTRENPSDGPEVSPALRAHGVLSRAERYRERERTLRQVVAPAVDALFAGLDVKEDLHAV